MFTIAKLRSSGSENSKLQEVGRGLRLPVDENGNRISNEEFTLNYIVDFTEADFAQKLVDQINGELPQTAIISEEKLKSANQVMIYLMNFMISVTLTDILISNRKQEICSLQNILILLQAYLLEKLKIEIKINQNL